MISKNQIKRIQSLHLKKNRDIEGLFIIEGVKLVTEFIQSKQYRIKCIAATKEFIDENKAILINHVQLILETSYEDLKKISTQQSPNHVLAVVYKKEDNLNTEALHKGFTLFLDDIRDPGNLGTIIRLADWYGLTQIICSENTTELYNPKTVQASMGAILRVNVIYQNFNNFYKECKTLPIYGAVLDGENIYKTNLKPGIIIIGNEANGISENTLTYITQKITIPAANSNGSESLNAAIACSIICSEFYRQTTY